MWLGGGRGHVYDIIGTGRGWVVVGTGCTPRAEGAVLDRRDGIGGGGAVGGVLDVAVISLNV